MNRQRSIAWHYLLRAILIGAFSFYIMHLVKVDRLSYFIAPRMEGIVKLSAILLAMLAVYLLFAALWSRQDDSDMDCGCSHPPSSSKLGNTIAYSLFAAPLLLGWFVPDSVMGSNVVDMKGIVLSSSASSGAKTVEGSDAPSKGGLFYSDDPYVSQYSKLAERMYLQDPIVIEESIFLEASTAIDLFMKPFQGKRIQISGFIYRQDDMEDTQFVVARLAMECCSADSTPYGFLVEWPETSQLHEDDWVTVTGKLRIVDYDGMELVSIQAESIEPSAVPETPYVYPNYDILDE